MRRRRRLRFLWLGRRLLGRRRTGRGADRRRGASGDQQRQEHARAASGNRQQGEGWRKLKRVKFYTMGGHGSVRFVHLRLHSEYSIVDGMVRVDDAVDAAAADGMPALALTDLANVFGLVKFYSAARASGIKPIFGCDAWLTHDAERDQPFRALLIAQSRAGYLRLADWLTRAYRFNQYRGRAEMRHEWFDEGTEGLIALSGARSGEIGAALLQGNAAGARKAAQRW